MQIEIWSDVVCPWCYIGKRRLETALADFEHRDEVDVVLRSFRLDPTATNVPDGTVVEMLARKYSGGDLAAARQMVARTEATAAAEGLDFDHASAPHVGTDDAHRLLQLAGAEGEPGAQRDLAEALFAAYFQRSENVADHEILRHEARAVGLDPGRVDAVLRGDEYVEEVDRDVREAAALGATGVPFFVVDRRYGVSGAQPAEVFAQVLRQAWAATHPSLESVTGQADACGPDGCAS